jgi:hypothetical protein
MSTGAHAPQRPQPHRPSHFTAWKQHVHGILPSGAASMGYFHQEAYKACSRPSRPLAQSRVLTVPQVKFIPGLSTPKRRPTSHRRTTKAYRAFHRPGSLAKPVGNSFDHLVGDREQERRNLDADRLSRPKIDDKLKFGRLLHRQIARFGALENAWDVLSAG